MTPHWNSRLETHSKQAEDARDGADIDYARLIHSASFRRLQGKTQILNLGDSDFYRTRLTHSLEVSQIAMGLVRQLEKMSDLPPHIHKLLPEYTRIQAIGLSHDLGHPPFGHGGEVALNYCMRNNGGFEGNGQTLRILSRLESFSENAGANLTCRTLLGVLKYPARYEELYDKSCAPKLMKTETLRLIDRDASKPPKCYLDSEKDIVDKILSGVSFADKNLFCSFEKEEGKHGKTRHKSFDCSIMDSADDIAYGVHDLEDAIALNLLNKQDFQEIVTEQTCNFYLDILNEKYPNEFGNNVYEGFVQKLFSDPNTRKRQISRLVHHFMTHTTLIEHHDFQEPLLRYRLQLQPNSAKFLEALKKLVFKKVIQSPNVQQLEFKGQQMVVSVFEAIASEPTAFLPLDIQQKYRDSNQDLRIICDYVASMTDGFLLKTYERLFSPRMGSVFDHL